MTFDEFRTQLFCLKTENGRCEHRVEGSPSHSIVIEFDVLFRGCTFREPVTIKHVIFKEFVDFSEWRCQATLRIEHCTFEKGLRLADTSVEGLCSLKECTFDDQTRGWLDFRRMNVGGMLDCTNITSKVGIDFANLKTGDDAWFHGAHLTALLQTKDDTEPDVRLKECQKTWAEPECRANTTYMKDCALHVSGASIGQHLFFQNDGGRDVSIHGMLDIRAKVTGNVAISNATITATETTTSLNMVAATVGGSLYIGQSTKITGQIDLRTKVAGQVAISNATITATKSTKPLDMAPVTVGGTLFIDEGTKIIGQVDLRAKVTGHVAISNATIMATELTLALDMETAIVGGLLFINQGTKITGQVDLRAKVTGQVEISNATITATESTTALVMESASVGGNLFIRELTRIRGRINLNQATLGGMWISKNSKESYFSIPKEVQGWPARELLIEGDLDLTNATIHGPCHIHHLSHFGKIDARHLTVHGDLDICGSLIGRHKTPQQQEWLSEEFKKPEPTPIWTNEETWQRWIDQRREGVTENVLDLEMAEIHGRLWLKGTRFLGSVALEDVEVDGDAIFNQSQIFRNLRMRSAIIKGRAFASSDSLELAVPAVQGKIDLAFANIQLIDLRLAGSGAEFQPDSIDLTGATVDTISLKGEAMNRQTPGIRADQAKFTTINCDGLQINELPDARTRQDHWRGALFVAMFILISVFLWSNPNAIAILSFGMFVLCLAWPWCRRHDPRKPAPVTDSILDHLHLIHPFSRGYFVMIEQRLRSQGKEEQADEVFLMRRKREREEAKNPQYWSAFLDFIMGYGVRVQRLVIAFLLIGFLNWSVFLDKNSIERPIVFVQNRIDGPAWGGADPEPGSDAKKTSKNVWPSDGGRAKGEDEWDAKHAFFLALRLQVPIIQLVTENDWTPATRPMEHWLVRWTGFSYADFASLTMVANLLLIPLLIAGLTGYNKKL